MRGKRCKAHRFTTARDAYKALAKSMGAGMVRHCDRCKGYHVVITKRGA